MRRSKPSSTLSTPMTACSAGSGRTTSEDSRTGYDWADGAGSSSAAETFDRLAGAALVKLGYEKDNAWVNACPEGRSPVEGG